MSGMDEVTYLAAKSMGADEVTTQQIATAFSLLHVLQVYTASMVRVSSKRMAIRRLLGCPHRWWSRCMIGWFV